MSNHHADPPGDDIDDLDARFAAFRTLPTPPPIPVDQLPAPRRGLNPRWLVAAAAVVALTLISVAVLAGGRDDPGELTTTAPPVTAGPSSSTSAPGTTGPPPTSDTTAPTTSAVTPPSSSSPVTTGPATTQVTIPEPTATTEREPIPPPTSIPLGAPIPDGQWRVQFQVVDPRPTEASTTIGVKVSYVNCAGTEVPGPRLHDPVVTETDEAVVITFWADALGPPDQLFTCPGIIFATDAPPDYTVTLSAPLGKRWVYDGRSYSDSPPFLVLDPNVREP